MAAMDAYHDPTQTASPAGPLDQPRFDSRTSAPSRDELAQWEAEAGQFLRNVERRLNGILVSLDTGSSGKPTAAPAAAFADAAPLSEQSPTEPSADGVDRIAALKAQLARKLHDFNETSDTGFGSNSQREGQS